MNFKFDDNDAWHYGVDGHCLNFLGCIEIGVIYGALSKNCTLISMSLNLTFSNLFVLKTPFWCAHCFWHHQIRYITCVTCPSYNLLYRVLKRWPMVSKSGFWQFNIPCRLQKYSKIIQTLHWNTLFHSGVKRQYSNLRVCLEKCII